MFTKTHHSHPSFHHTLFFDRDAWRQSVKVRLHRKDLNNKQWEILTASCSGLWTQKEGRQNCCASPKEIMQLIDSLIEFYPWSVFFYRHNHEVNIKCNSCNNFLSFLFENSCFLFYFLKSYEVHVFFFFGSALPFDQVTLHHIATEYGCIESQKLWRVWFFSKTWSNHSSKTHCTTLTTVTVCSSKITSQKI